MSGNRVIWWGDAEPEGAGSPAVAPQSWGPGGEAAPRNSSFPSSPGGLFGVFGVEDMMDVILKRRRERKEGGRRRRRGGMRAN